MFQSARGELEQKYKISVQDSEAKLHQFDALLGEKNQEIAEGKKEIEVLSTKVKDLELSSRNDYVSHERIESESVVSHESGCETEQSAPLEIQGNLQTAVSKSNVNDNDELKAFVVKIKELEDKLSDRDDALTMLTKEKTNTEAGLREEISRLQAELDNLGLELEDTGKEACKIQREHGETLAKLRSENRNDLAKTADDLHRRFEQEKQALTEEADAACKVYQQKTTHLERELENARREFAEILLCKETAIENLTSLHSDLDREYRSLLTDHESLKTTVCNNKTESDDVRKTEIEKKDELLREIRELEDSFSPRESELNAKISSLIAETERLKSELADVANSSSPPL